MEYLHHDALIMVHKLEIYYGTQPIGSFFASELIQVIRPVILNNADAKDYRSRFKKCG